MPNGIKQRQIELKRQSQVSAIEADCLSLKIGEEKRFSIMDTLVHQRIRTRLSRQKASTLIVFETEVSKDNINEIVVIRKA
ncbi:MAG: hypothetical protein ACLVKO_09120 [Dysgonomonas sp.]